MDHEDLLFWGSKDSIDKATIRAAELAMVCEMTPNTSAISVAMAGAILLAEYARLGVSTCGDCECEVCADRPKVDHKNLALNMLEMAIVTGEVARHKKKGAKFS